MFHIVVFSKKGLFLLLGCTYLLVVCHKQVIQMIESRHRFTDEKNLQTFILFADLGCNLFLPVDIFGFTIFITILLLSCLSCGMVQELLRHIFPMSFSRFSISSSEISVWLCLLLVVYRGSLFLYVLWM